VAEEEVVAEEKEEEREGVAVDGTAVVEAVVVDF
jgi:hypothetical protein